MTDAGRASGLSPADEAFMLRYLAGDAAQLTNRP
jgi:hypothetical protein